MRFASATLLATFALAPTPTARAASPARESLTIREPSWKGAAPTLVTSEYREALARLQALAASHPSGAPLRITSPAPCVLRVERGDAPAAFADAKRGFIHVVAWIDLRLAARLGAQAFGRNPGFGPSLVATCAWLTGAAGLSLSTQIVAYAGSQKPAVHALLEPDGEPRVCVSNDVEPEEVAAPLRRLVQICGGKTEAIPVVPERPTSAEEVLVTFWDGALAERVEELVRDGNEGAVLEPLSRRSVAARIMLQHFRRSERLLERKLAPVLAGLLGKESPQGALDELFEAEATRRREALRGSGPAGVGDPRMDAVNHVLERIASQPGSAGYFDAQSVVEDVVYAARRWCKEPDRVKAGGAILRKIVERTIGGEYWNSSGPALKALVCDCREESRGLLANFASFAFGGAPSEPSRPSLPGERKAVEDLRAGKCDVRLASADASTGDPLANWSRRDRAALRAFLLMAESAK